jgi:hypothetical protein
MIEIVPKENKEDAMSRLIPRISTVKIADAQEIREGLDVIDEVYIKEKNWIPGLGDQIPENIRDIENVSWFLSRVNGKPAGVLRLLYDPAMDVPAACGVSLEPGVDLSKLSEKGRFVEIGRFAVKPCYRRNILVSLRLMVAAIREVVERGYTHFITDVFEGEATSPFHFHTRILGFEVIGRHLRGELNCSCTRIILTLDILKAYRNMKQKRSAILAALTDGVADIIEKRLSCAG